MIILDLNSEQSPVWSSTEAYYGKPFIWCLLHNYGGTRGIYGDLSVIGSSPIASRKTPGNTMMGVGMTPEAIEHNPVVYDLMVSFGYDKPVSCGWHGGCCGFCVCMGGVLFVCVEGGGGY